MKWRCACTSPSRCSATPSCGSLRLPTFEVEGKRLVKRLTLVVRDRAIEHVFYSVFPPNRSASDVVDWLRRARDRG